MMILVLGLSPEDTIEMILIPGKAGGYYDDIDTRLLSFIFIFSIALDTISKDNPIKDGHTIVSAGGNFELGFFSPGNSKNRYIGIWYKNLPKGKEVVWVANRVNPLNDISGLLAVSSKGIVLVNGNQDVTWSSNSSTSNPVAQLLDTEILS
ncbi:hypothetical protein CQW23_18274 [Capsicum baccatum]|uniref:Bulb-type lectin domain-containing protein n=1 Tax=Capsicum baccatum TaxID=33114 RepID=A0A2G2WGF1_CAPBA|nr:hypothetical protein CQW23_18274 [Capsicum baccatum]